jgi:hypothetical protein
VLALRSGGGEMRTKNKPKEKSFSDFTGTRNQSCQRVRHSLDCDHKTENMNTGELVTDALLANQG